MKIKLPFSKILGSVALGCCLTAFLPTANAQSENLLVTIYPGFGNEDAPSDTPGMMKFRVTLSQASTNTVTVDYRTTDGDAVSLIANWPFTYLLPEWTFFGALQPAQAGVDYTATSGTLTFAPGVTNQYILVPILPNALVQTDRPFLVQILNPVNAQVYNDDSTIGMILDDDSSGRTVVTIDNASVIEPDLDTNGVPIITNMVFHVHLNCSRHTPFVLQYATTTAAGGVNATANVDYTTTAGSITFDNGMADVTILVPIIGDNLNETNEIFRINLLLPPANSVVWVTNSLFMGRGTIYDNDPMPYISISGYTNYEGDDVNNTGVFPVTLSAPSGRDVKVNYATANGSAIAGQDYAAKSGSLTIKAGTTNAQIGVTVYGDVIPESDETFYVTLTKPVYANLRTAQAIGVIVNDDVPHTISVVSTGIVERHTGFQYACFDVVLWPPSSQPVTVEYATSSGSASAGSDFEPVTGLLWFPPGITNQCVSVKVFGDIAVEADEVFYLDLSKPVNATVGAARGSCVITNDDGLPGQIDHFTWAPIGATQQVNNAFAVTITARDYFGNVATNFTSSVALSAFENLFAQGGNLLGDLLSGTPTGGNMSAGFAFLATNDVRVTHFRYYSGSRVSLWTEEGVLLASMDIAGMPGQWASQALAQPINLTGGRIYILSVYAGTDSQIFFSARRVYAAGPLVVVQNYVRRGDAIPNEAFDSQVLVDLEYQNVITGGAVPLSISQSGLFVNGVWSGNLAVTAPRAQLFLRATDSDGHWGNSAPFAAKGVSLEVHLVQSPGGELQLLSRAAYIKVSCKSLTPFVLEASSDLKTWTQVDTSSDPQNQSDYTEPAGNRMRFFRTRSLP